jgi:hypothetical protein
MIWDETNQIKVKKKNVDIMTVCQEYHKLIFFPSSNKLFAKTIQNLYSSFMFDFLFFSNKQTAKKWPRFFLQKKH